MKIRNMENAKGNAIANQFVINGTEEIIVDTEIGPLPEQVSVSFFQSYDSVIVKITRIDRKLPTIELDSHYWDYSVTTNKYRNRFLGETKKETQAKIDSGEYKLVNLN